MRKMRVGIVGGQKRKTEAHLFKCLEKMDIEVAWHVEAMTTQAFSDDCDAIVSMVDYVGHGLFAQAKLFAAKKNIPFRQISFNWAKTKPTFVELQTKFNVKYNNVHTENVQTYAGDIDMKKVPRENEHIMTMNECLKELKTGFKVFQRLESEGKFKCATITVGMVNVKLYDVREVRTALTEHKRSAIMKEGFLNESDEMVKLKKTVAELLAHDNKETTEKIFNENQSEKILNDSQITEKPITVTPIFTGRSYRERTVLCRVHGETLIPLTDVSSMEEAKDLSTIELNPDENEFVVIQIVGSFKAKAVVVFEDTKWGK